MKALLTIALAVLSTACFAQKHNTYFLKKDGRYVSQRDSADYIRVVSEPDSGSTLYNVAEFDLKGKIKSQGKSSVIDPPKYDGVCITYYPTGRKESILNYKDGYLVNTEYDFYPNGKPYIVIQHPESSGPGDDITNSYSITANYDSLGKAVVVDGNGEFKRYDDGFKTVIESGNVKNGKMDGEWRGTTSNGKRHFIEKYDKGTLLTGALTDETGLTTTYAKNRETIPGYEGGLGEFYNYLGSHIKYPDADRRKEISGKVIMSFVVEKDGKISNIKILHSVSPNIDREAIRVVKNSPAWIPGTQFGRPVKVLYTLPIQFALKD